MIKKISLFSVLFLLLLDSGYSQKYVLTGLDVVERDNFAIFKNKRVGVIVNHTSVDREGNHLVDVFIKNGVNLKAIFTPEHGLKGTIEGGETVNNSEYKGIPVYSLYGKTKRPLKYMLENIDALVFDIQDVGTRFYTYLTTMGYAMEEAAKYNIEFIVLDRPNPIGSKIEGPILDRDIKSFTAYYHVPLRHSLTPGEMARYHNIIDKVGVKLNVVKMQNYTKDMFFDETGLIWVNTSPNIRNLKAAILYSGLGCFEATNISVGRGTETPFEIIGSPWLKAREIINELKKVSSESINYSYVEFTPSYDMYSGKLCKGIKFNIRDRRKLNTFDLFVYLFYYIYKYNRDEFTVREKEIAKMTGSKKFFKFIKKGKTPQFIIDYYRKDIEKFKKLLDKKSILIYPLKSN